MSDVCGASFDMSDVWYCTSPGAFIHAERRSTLPAPPPPSNYWRCSPISTRTTTPPVFPDNVSMPHRSHQCLFVGMIRRALKRRRHCLTQNIQPTWSSYRSNSEMHHSQRGLTQSAWSDKKMPQEPGLLKRSSPFHLTASVVSLQQQDMALTSPQAPICTWHLTSGRPEFRS